MPLSQFSTNLEFRVWATPLPNLCGCRSLYSGPHGCTANVLNRATSPAPFNLFFFFLLTFHFQLNWRLSGHYPSLHIPRPPSWDQSSVCTFCLWVNGFPTVPASPPLVHQIQLQGQSPSTNWRSSTMWSKRPVVTQDMKKEQKFCWRKWIYGWDNELNLFCHFSQRRKSA